MAEQLQPPGPKVGAPQSEASSPTAPSQPTPAAPQQTPQSQPSQVPPPLPPAAPQPPNAPQYGPPQGPPQYGPPQGPPQYGPPQGQPQYGPPQGPPQYGPPQYGPPQGQGQPPMATPQYGAQPPQYGAPPQGQPYPQYGPPQGVPQGQPQYQMPQYGMPQYGMPPQAPYGGYQPPMNMPIPQSMLRGVLLMKVGAILSLISPLLAFVPGSFSNNVLTNMSRLKNTPSSQAVQAFEVSFVIVLLITTAGVFGLWVWMAVMNNKGRSWARIVATVFFGFSVLGTLRIMLIGSPPVDIVVNLVITVIGAASIYFLFQPESSAYYKSRSHALT